MDIVTYALLRKAGYTKAEANQLLAQKVDKPSAEIPAGYICVSDGHGGCTWVAPAE